MASDEQQQHAGLLHHIRRGLAEATLGLAGLGLIAGISEVAAPGGSVQITPPGVPEETVPASPSGESVEPSGSFYSVMGPGLAAELAAPAPHSARPVPAGQQEMYQHVKALIEQGHRENQTFTKVASMLQRAIGAQNITLESCAVIVGRLIERYAYRVLMNLVDDAAEKTSEAIEHAAERLRDEFAQILSGERAATPGPATSELNPNLDDTLPKDAERVVSDLRHELVMRDASNPQTATDSRTLSAFQGPAPCAAEALSAYDPDNSDYMASYLRYRVAAEGLHVFLPDIQVHDLARIVDTPLRSQEVSEPVDPSNAGLAALDSFLEGTPWTTADLTTCLRSSSAEPRK